MSTTFHTSTMFEVGLAYGYKFPNTLPGSHGSTPMAHPCHTMLTLTPQDTTQCTWIHIGNGPFQYEVLIEHDKDSSDTLAENSVPIGGIHSTQLQALYELARSIEPQRCQLYIAALLEGMIERGLGHIDGLIASHFRSSIERSIAQTMQDVGVDATTIRVWAFVKSRQYRFHPQQADMLRDTCFYDTCMPAPTEFRILEERMDGDQYLLEIAPLQDDEQRSALDSVGFHAPDHERRTCVRGGDAVAGPSRPVTNPRLLLSNEWDARPLEQRATVFRYMRQ
ncbi:uncharacterized protein DSM5745_04498 [Aspergillus mulundensis]|uniref:Uncharacterized protein n=1 Tax=Aspergillus mulundensis TaxID=1810919 RepID=A0A3D8SCV4_9EURO|nr:hypothetical protein DSM5745_04498 [Aspergillus mulundensis]RDW84172.1 hypothetical protein DSM5745_04498 [Aspergillus mulundensis]